MNTKFYSVRKIRHILLCVPRINSLGIIRSLGCEGITPILVCLRPRNPLQQCFWSSRYIKVVHYVDSMEEGLEFIISRWGQETEKSFLHVMSEQSVRLLDENYDRLKDSFYFFRGKGAHTLASYFDKGSQCALAAGCGLTAPACEVVRRGSLPERLSYPVYIKCRDSFGAWKTDMAICRTPDEVKTACEGLRSAEWLMQEYIEKKTEVSLQGISLHNGAEIYLPYVKAYKRMREKDYGTYMYYDRNWLSEDVYEGIRRAIRKLGFNGCFEIEFLQDKAEKLFFLEINMRYSASNQGMRYGGVNLPLEWALAECEGQMCTDSIVLREKRFYVMNEILDIETQLLGGRVALAAWLTDVWRANAFYLFSFSDPVPFLKYAVILGKRALRKLGKLIRHYLS